MPTRSGPFFMLMLVGTATLAQSGTLDPTFGDNGIVTGTQWGAQAVDLQADQRIVVLTGTAWLVTDPSEIPPIEYYEGTRWVQRFHTSGALDPSFGESGTVDLGPLGAMDLTVLDDDRIVLTGTALGPDDVQAIFLACLLPDGALDASFGSGGIAWLAPGITAGADVNGLLRDAQGRLVVYGSVAPSSGNSDLLVARFLADGIPDPSFGVEGVMMMDVAGDPQHGIDRVHDAALDPSGRLVLTGRCATDLPKVLFVARLTVDGVPDAAFGTNGFNMDPLTGSPWTEGRHVAVLADGRVMLTGERHVLNVFVRRYQANGALDPTFGTNGELSAPMPADHTYSLIEEMVPLPDGGLLWLSNTQWISLGQFGPDGVLVPSFANEGMLQVESLSWAEPSDLAVQDDGRIIVVGTAHEDVVDHLVMFRTYGASLTGISEITAGRNELRILGNPIGPESTVEFDLAQPGAVSVHVFDALGRHAAVLLPERKLPAGTHRLPWSQDMAAGTYRAELRSPEGRTSVPVCVVDPLQ